MKASFTASSLVCHPEGAVFLALSEKGLVQCFDAALTPVQLCFPNEEQVTSTVLHLTVATDCHFYSDQIKNGETVTLSTAQVTSTVLDLTGYFRSGLSLRGGAWAAPPSTTSTTASGLLNIFV